jgi:hypothetical protein
MSVTRPSENSNVRELSFPTFSALQRAGFFCTSERFLSAELDAWPARESLHIHLGPPFRLSCLLRRPHSVKAIAGDARTALLRSACASSSVLTNLARSMSSVYQRRACSWHWHATSGCASVSQPCCSTTGAAHTSGDSPRRGRSRRRRERQQQSGRRLWPESARSAPRRSLMSGWTCATRRPGR